MKKNLRNEVVAKRNFTKAIIVWLLGTMLVSAITFTEAVEASMELWDHDGLKVLAVAIVAIFWGVVMIFIGFSRMITAGRKAVYYERIRKGAEKARAYNATTAT